MLSHPWELLEFKFLMIGKISSSLVFNKERVSSALKQKVGSLLEVCNGLH